MRVMFILIALVATVATGAAGRANPLSSLDLARYEWQRDKEFAAQAGQRFLDDLKARSPEVAANVEDAVRYKIQAEEARKFARQRRFVIAAYGTVWAVVALFAAAIFARQRRLAAQIEELESRLRAADAERAA